MWITLFALLFKRDSFTATGRVLFRGVIREKNIAISFTSGLFFATDTIRKGNLLCSHGPANKSDLARSNPECTRVKR